MSFSYGQAQNQQKQWTGAFSFGHQRWSFQEPYCFSPINYQWQFRNHSAIPVDEFEPVRERQKNLQNFYANIRATRSLNSYSNIWFEIGIGSISNAGTNGSCLVYTDMIDVDHGFVLPSRYRLVDYEANSTITNFGAYASIELPVLGIDQQIGLGLKSYYVFRTDYSLLLSDDRIPAEYYYEDLDMESERLYAIYPELVYQVKLYEWNAYKLSAQVNYSARRTHMRQLSFDSVRRAQRGRLWGFGLVLSH